MRTRTERKKSQTYMRRVVVEAKMIKQDGKIRVVQFQEMLESAAAFVGRDLDIVDLDAWDLDSA